MLVCFQSFLLFLPDSPPWVSLNQPWSNYFCIRQDHFTSPSLFHSNRPTFPLKPRGSHPLPNEHSLTSVSFIAKATHPPTTTTTYSWHIFHPFVEIWLRQKWRISQDEQSPPQQRRGEPHSTNWTPTSSLDPWLKFTRFLIFAFLYRGILNNICIRPIWLRMFGVIEGLSWGHCSSTLFWAELGKKSWLAGACLGLALYHWSPGEIPPACYVSSLSLRKTQICA